MKNYENTYKTDFTNVGKEFLKTDDDKKTVIKEADILEWKDIAGSHPFMPASGIKETIKELNIPKVDKIAYGGGFGLSVEPSAGYGFYGIQGHYKGCKVQIFVLDTGVSISPLFMRVFNEITK